MTAGVLFVLVSLAQFKVAASIGHNCSVLYLLNVQPYPDASDFSGMDIGLSLIPAVHLAAEEINNRSDILTGHHLKVIDIEGDPCVRSTIAEGVVNLYSELLTRDCIVGIMGFPCSTSTNVLAPITGHSSVGYVTLANSVSPQHRNIIKYPNLFHTLSSTGVHSKAIISLMRLLNWTRIGLVFDIFNIFNWSTGRDFEQRIQNLSDIQLTTKKSILDLHSEIKQAFKVINDKEARISYWLGNNKQYAHFLCEAYKRRFLWPGFVYIVRHKPDIIRRILKINTPCNVDELKLAMEGVILLEYRPYVDDATKLFSGWTYSQFRQRYIDRLDEHSYQTGMNLTDSIYASSFYDQVWTFALAINNSLPSIYSQNLSFLDYTFKKTKTITDIIKRELLNISFQGASGYIKFDENHEISSFVDIMQIQNGTIKLIAVYDPFTMNITPINLPNIIPPDRFEIVYYRFPLWIDMCIVTVQATLFCLITINMLLISYWRKEREIKATSYILSMLLTSSCYLLIIGSVIWTSYRIIIIHNTTLHTVLCNVSLWFTTLGLDLLLATLFFRLFRVVHIFRIKPFKNPSKYLSDKYIILYVLVTCSIKVIMLTIWGIVDLYHSNTVAEYDPTATPPIYRAIKTCSSNEQNVWFIVSYLYSAVLLLFVLFFAIQTRRIRKTAFKDTKKVNLFLSLIIVTQATVFTLKVIFSEIDNQIGADLSEWIGFCSVPLLCQLCLIVPKLLPLAVKKDKLRRGKTLSSEYSLFNEFDGIWLKARHSLRKLVT